MIRLRVFGSLDLRGDDGREVLSVLAQPKRTALLAYLATRAARGPVRRDSVVGLLWPELEDARARHALAKSTHFLRQALGPDALVTRSDAELALNPDRIWTDVGAFEEALGQGRREEALELRARGPLLEGFHLSDAPELERWLDEERTRTDRAATEAAEALSRECHARRDASGAVLWARRAHELDPYSDARARRLMDVLDATGDVASAIQTYEAFVARLRAELESDPDPATVALANRLREPQRERSAPLPVAVSLPPLLGAEALRREAATPWRLAAAVAVLAALVGAAVLRPTHEARAMTEGRMLVAPFENRTGSDDFLALGEMTADWLARGIRNAGLGEVVDPLSAIEMSRATRGVSSSGWQRALAVSRAAGAPTVLWGGYFLEGDSLYLEANVSDLRSGEIVLALDPVAAAANEPMRGLEALSERVLGALSAQNDARFSVQMLRGSPPTFTAYREYMEGERAAAERRDAEAGEHFAAAFRADTTFDLALVRRWFVVDPAARDSVEALLTARAARLAPLDRLALDFFIAWRSMDYDALAHAAEAAARLSPGSYWSHNAAWVATHQNRPWDALRFEAEVDPEHGWARTHPGYWAIVYRAQHMVGDYEGQLQSADRIEAMDPSSWMPEMIRLQAYAALGRAAEVDSLARVVLARPQSGFWGLSNPPEAAWVDVAWRELAIHGHRAATNDLLERALAWFNPKNETAWVQGQDDSVEAAFWWEEWRGRVLYDLGRLDDVEAIERELLAAGRHPNDWIDGYYGRASAARGDREAAERAILTLRSGVGDVEWAAIDEAAIRVLLGDLDEAVEVLGSQPNLSLPELHQQVELLRLGGNPAFDRVVAPRG